MAKVTDLFGNETNQDEDNEIKPLKDGSSRQGRYAEFMVCAYLTKMGHHVVHVDTIGFDIILAYEGRSYRIDVKSTNSYIIGKEKERCEWGFTRWKYINKRYVGQPITPSDTDILALYHLAFDTVVFIPVLGPVYHIRVPASQVRSAGNGQESLVITIQQLLSAKPQAVDDTGDVGDAGDAE